MSERYEWLKANVGATPTKALCPHCLGDLERARPAWGCPRCEVVMAREAVVYAPLEIEPPSGRE